MIIPYRIISKTKDNKSITETHGTDERIHITLHSETGSSNTFEFEGDHDGGDLDAMTAFQEDIGVITAITLRMASSADDWTPDFIKILRKTEQDDVNTAHGWSEFSKLGKVTVNSKRFQNTHLVSKPVTVTSSGQPVASVEKVYVVQFDHNPSQNSRTVMKYEQTWSDRDMVRMSTGSEEGKETGVTAGWESPDTILGGFSVEVQAAWNSKVTNLKESEKEHYESATFSWEIEADPYTSVFRLQVFKMNVSQEDYQDSEGTNLKIRSVKGPIVPAHLGDFLFIPRIDDGKVDPVTMSELQDDWLQYMEPENEKWVRDRFLDKWLAKGWVIYDPQPPEEPIEFQGVVVTDALHIRENHDPKSKVVGYLKRGDEVTILEFWSQANNIWAKLKPSKHTGTEQWSAVLVGRNRYINITNLPRG